MGDNVQRSQGRGSGYKFDRGGMPAEMGPYVGTVKSNVDSTRGGRLRVWIEQFSGSDQNNVNLWRTVKYLPPFYGVTPQSGTNQGAGTYVGNPNAYGMWFTPPDLGTQVICFFIGGDPDDGYYIGCIPSPGLNHMIPAIGASTKYQADNNVQKPYFVGATQVPVVEINDANNAVAGNPKFYDQVKPVHSYVSGQMIQQGLIKDVIRGPITSNSQRESPSAVFGISTPGRAIYQGGLSEVDIKAKLEAGTVKPQEATVIGRRGGHSIVMDDGNLQGYDNLIRIRTSKGHQITMSDDGDCFYITHANGQSWIELGSEGTVDIFSTNSVNVRTKGEINLHADKTINMYAGESFNIKSPIVNIEGAQKLALTSAGTLAIKSTAALSVNSDGSLSLSGSLASLKSDGALVLKGRPIDLNGAIPAIPGLPTSGIQDVQLPDTIFKTNIGWEVEQGKITTIVSRAPTHEPYPYHNLGVPVSITLSGATTDQTNTTLPPGFSISRDI